MLDIVTVLDIVTDNISDRRLVPAVAVADPAMALLQPKSFYFCNITRDRNQRLLVIGVLRLVSPCQSVRLPYDKHSVSGVHDPVCLG